MENSQPTALRSRIMRAVKGKNTAPEMHVRSLVHRLGYRFRLHGADLPGKPDLVLSRHRKTIFVHGCFWHGHPCARGARMPKTNARYWRDKISRNAARDSRALAVLRRRGWQVLIVWECELKEPDSLRRKILSFLERGHKS